MAVYFITSEQPPAVKIGFSADPWLRFSKIQADSCGEVRLRAIIDGDEPEERGLHARFAAYRARGEWFRFDGELAAYIATLPQAERSAPVRKAGAFWNGWHEGRLADEVGCHRGTLTRIRLGQFRTTPDLAIKLQRATGVSAIKLVFGDLAEEAA